MKLTLKEMNGLLNGKCLPSDLIVGETLAEYLVRKFADLEQKLAVSQREFRAADTTIENLQMQLNAEREAKLALAAELSVVESIHKEAVFITDEHYEQCPPEVQKMIRSLAVLKIPAYQSFLDKVRAEHFQSYADGIAARMKDKSLSMRQKERLNFAWAEAKSYAAELHNNQLRKGVQS